jgi:ribosomal protein RSM22 (predicted rRNA methylase)
MDVRLPPALRTGLDAHLQAASRRHLSEQAAALSARYRRNEPSSQSIRSETDVLAYLLARLPATYAAAVSAFGRLKQARPDFAPRRLLDVGAGPGTAAWAAHEAWPELASITMLDHNPRFAAMARALASQSAIAPLVSADIRVGNLADAALGDEQKFDLIVANYALTELPLPEVERAIAALLRQASGMLVIVEPGTTRDYQRLMATRQQLIASGAAILAPCPHAKACPLPPNDWCHFSVRLPRSRDHMLVKDATVPFEDEKFSYLVVETRPDGRSLDPHSRVLREPVASKHAITLAACTPDGLSDITIARRDREAFRTVRKLHWGDRVALPMPE